MSQRTVAVSGGYRLLVHDEGEGGGLPLLFLNSLAADQSMWDAVRARLPGRSVTYDARGHGRSDVVPGDADLAGLADDALAVMDATGLDRAILCGLSLGGITAMELAARIPERIAGLVLANTALCFPPPSMWAERAVTARAGSFETLVQPTLERWLTAEFRTAQPETTEQVRRIIAATPAEGYAAACAALANANATAALASYDGPLLVIAGRHDLSTPVERAEEIRSIAKQAELVVLDAAHLAAVERPDEFAGALTSFAQMVGRTS